MADLSELGEKVGLHDGARAWIKLPTCQCVVPVGLAASADELEGLNTPRNGQQRLRGDLRPLVAVVQREMGRVISTSRQALYQSGMTYRVDQSIQAWATAARTDLGMFPGARLVQLKVETG